MPSSLQDADGYLPNSIPIAILNSNLNQQESVIDMSIAFDYTKDLVPLASGKLIESDYFKLPLLDNYKFKSSARRKHYSTFDLKLHAVCQAYSIHLKREVYVMAGAQRIKSKNPADMKPFDPDSKCITSTIEDNGIDDRESFELIWKIRLQEFACLDVAEQMEPFDLVEDVSKHLSGLYWNGMFSDLYISSCHSNIRLHRFILEKRCIVFKWIIAAANHDRVVFKDIVKPNHFLFYLYTGQIFSSKVKDILDLYENANRCCVFSLRGYCSKILSKKLNLNIVLRLYRLATLFADLRMNDTALTFMLENFDFLTQELWNKYIVNSPRLKAEITGYP